MENRKSSIIQLLKQQNETFLTSEQIAKKFHVSQRTIRNDIKALTSELQRNGAQIISQSGYGHGYSLQIINEGKFQKYYTDISENQVQMNPSERYDYYILRLLMEKKPISTEHLANEIYISRKQAFIDIQSVRSILNENALHLESKQKAGIFISGSERKKRILIAEILIRNPSYLKIFYSFDVNLISELIQKYLKENEIDFPQLALSPTIQLICTIFQRCISGNGINLISDIKNIMQCYSCYPNAIKMVSIMPEYIRQYISDNDICEIAAILESNRIHERIPIYMECFLPETDHILNLIKNRYSIDFKYDQKLREDLAMHIYRMLLKYDTNAQYKIPFDKSILYHFPFSFELGVFCVYHIFGDDYLNNIESEASFLTYHFALAINRTITHPSDILIVVDALSRGEINYLYNEFMKNFNPYIRSLSIRPSYKLDTININKFDHIINLNNKANYIANNYFSDHGKMKVIKLLTGTLLTIERLQLCFPENHWQYLPSVSMNQLILKTIASQHLDKSIISMIHQRKRYIPSIIDNNTELFIYPSDEKQTQLYISCSRENIFILIIQGKDGVITDLDIYTGVKDLLLLHSEDRQNKVFSSYNNISYYLCDMNHPIVTTLTK